ncbi:MAG TPA: response regulator [Kamptonema sp.]|nr:response regulator [Kamptonema sp.]
MSHQENIIYSDDRQSNKNCSCYQSVQIQQREDKEEGILGKIDRASGEPELCWLLQEMSDLQTALGQAALVLRTDAKGIINYVNAKVCQISQYSAKELIGKEYAAIKSGYHSQQVFINLLATLASGKVWKGAIKNQAKDGSYYWVDTTIVPFLNELGKPLQYIAIGFDITERKASEKALTEANRIKDEFLAVVSHELRSPLSAILGWAQLALSRKLDEVTTIHALETIERNAKLQTQLIEDLLDLSRLLRGKLRLNIRPVEIVSVIEAALDTVRPAAIAKEIHLQTWFEPTIRYVLGDSDRLQQVIWNLVSNAIKFTPDRGRIEVRVNRNAMSAEIHVSDTGCGLNPEFLPHVFDYFRQADGSTTRTHGGLGLGLAIVRQLVELHGGSVWASSPGVGKGATFTVQLPLTKDRNAGEAELEAESKNSENSASQPLAGIKVLVVDDNADVREFLITALEAFGAQVKAVASVSAAIAELEQLQPDVLVSDIAMPGEDGYELIRQVRARELSEDKGRLPVVALTAYAREEDRAKTLEAGFQEHLAKPIEPSELVRTIAQLAALTERGWGNRGTLAAGETPPIVQASEDTKTEEYLATGSQKLPLLLVVEDNGDVLSYLQSLLGSYYQVAVAHDGIEGLEKAKRLKPDLILSDQVMPRSNGLELLREIRNSPELSLTPVIFLTARRGTQARIDSYDAGADDYISKPFDDRELLARVRNLLRSRAAEHELAAQKRQLEMQKQQLEKVNQALQHLATFDSLTELANRHHFNQCLETEWRRGARDRAPLSLIMCDIDYFKLYNDTYGHQAGDECLRQVAAAIGWVAKRSGDLAARYGGEEFAVILPNTDREGAACVAEAIRTQVRNLNIEHKNSQVHQYVTVSLGVATWVPAPKSSPTTLIAVADEVLYRAKEEGRDRVVVASQITRD